MCCSWVNYRNLCCRPTRRWVKTGRSFTTPRCSTSSRSKRCRRGRSLSLWSRWESSLTLCTFPLTDANIWSWVVTIWLQISDYWRETHTCTCVSVCSVNRDTDTRMLDAAATTCEHLKHTNINLFYWYVSVKPASCCRNCTSCMDISSANRDRNCWKVNKGSRQQEDFGISLLLRPFWFIFQMRVLLKSFE